MSTFRLALLIWVIAGVTIAGTAVAVVLAVPQLQAESATLIPIAAGAGFILAFIASMVLARKITQARGGTAS